jgi:DNA-binding PadR family transcriptional regulator
MPPLTDDPATHLPLTPAVLHILLALGEGERHGYAIAQEVEHLSEGSMRMGPGTLYGSLQRMIASGLVEAATPRRGRADEDERRRYYRLTTLGRDVLRLELKRLNAVVSIARRRNLLREPRTT